MAADAVLVLILVIVAMVMFAFERIALEVTSVTLIVLLALSGVLTPEEAFSGLSNDTVIFIFTLLAMTAGLRATGVMQILARRAAFVRRLGERSFLAVMTVVVTTVGSVANNTAVSAAFLPIVSSAAARARIPRGRVLMPMAYASMLSGMILLFGTSTNMIVSEAMERFGMAPLGFTELAPAGLPAVLVAIVLMVLAGPYLFPARAGDAGAPTFTHREFVTEAVLTPESRFLGQTLDEIAAALELNILGMVRRGQWLPASANERVGADDRLVIRGSQRTIRRVAELRSIALGAELSFTSDTPTVLAEVVVPPHSRLVGRTIGEARFGERMGLLPLAIHRHPSVQREKPIIGHASLAKVRLAAGDMLLVSGPPKRLRELRGGERLVVLGATPYRRPRYRKASLAILIFGVALTLAATRVAPPAVVGLIGMLAMIATRCVDAREAFRVEWRVVLLIASLLALGTAMEKSGAGALVASALMPVAALGGAHGALFLVMLLTVLLSAPMSNQAAALVVLPVAIHVAQKLGLDPRAFAVGTCLAASCSFMTPLEPATALVYGPGRYRFADFLRAGAPLTLALLVLFTILIPRIWPLTGG